MLLNYHIDRTVLGFLCVGVRVRFGWGGIRAAGNSLLICGKLFLHKLRSGGCGEATDLLCLLGIETRFLTLSPIHSSLYRLNYPTALY
jgi:hypothetical protein